MTHKTSDPNWLYVYEERLAILCGAARPTLEQMEIAATEADEYVASRKSPPAPGKGQVQGRSTSETRPATGQSGESNASQSDLLL